MLCVEVAARGAQHFVARQAIVGERDNFLVVERLLDKIDRAMLDRRHRFCNVRARGEKNHRHQDVVLDQIMLQLEPAHPGHVEIDEEAAR